MADIRKVHGPSGPYEPGKKEKAVDAEKFKEIRKRMEEVGKVDPDEQKKRKLPGESRQEEETGPSNEPETPADEVSSFSEDSILDVQGGTPSSMKGSPPAPSNMFFQNQVNEEMSDDSGLLEETSFEETTPATPTQGPGQQAPGTGWTPEGQEPVTPGPPESDQRKGGPHGKTPEAHKDTKPEKKEDASAFFEQVAKQKEKKPEEIEAGGQVQGVVAPPQPMSSKPPSEKKDEKKIKPIPQEGTSMPLTAGSKGMPAPIAPVVPKATAPYANLHPQVQELFDRMVGVMTVMTMTGVKETVITLNTPQFASSVFFGTQIIIQEFSTAPQAFNIQLNATPQAVALFQGNANDLMAAFQSGNYNFRVNRLETGHLADRPEFRRKEKAGGDKQQTGDGPP